MTVEELRINNIVLSRGAQSVVKSIYENHVGYSKKETLTEKRLPIILIQPIPLTEEWLVKFGFEEDGVNWYYLATKDRFTDIGYSYNTKTNIIEINECELTGIKHVHQLQNLYFALTGEELTIKK